MFKKRAPKPEETSNTRSALDEIRQEEARVASLVLLAEQEAQNARHNAEQQAEELKAQARQNGYLAGQNKYEAMIQEARAEADQIITQAKAQANTITQNGQPFITSAAGWALKIVSGIREKE